MFWNLLYFYFNLNIQYIYLSIKFYIILIIITLFMGSWWALQEGSWGGWWNWDPSEVFGLLFLLAYLYLIHNFNKSIHIIDLYFFSKILFFSNKLFLLTK
jgi:cytochrome c biogenesis factor